MPRGLDPGDPFGAVVNEQRLLSVRDSDVMSGLGYLAARFAVNAIQGQYPVLRAAAESSETDQAGGGHRLSQPFWPVIEGTDLSGRPLTHTMHKKVTYSRSLGSGTLNNFASHFTCIEEGGALPESLGPGDELRKVDRSFGVTPLGQLVMLEYRGKIGGPCRAPCSMYAGRLCLSAGLATDRIQPAELIVPSDLYDINERLKASKLLQVAEGRMAQALKRLGNEHRDEGLPSRPADYYEPKLVTVARTDTPATGFMDRLRVWGGRRPR